MSKNKPKPTESFYIGSYDQKHFAAKTVFPQVVVQGTKILREVQMFVSGNSQEFIAKIKTAEEDTGCLFHNMTLKRERYSDGEYFCGEYWDEMTDKELKYITQLKEEKLQQQVNRESAKLREAEAVLKASGYKIVKTDD